MLPCPVFPLTDGGGKATFEYQGNTAGRDIIWAYIDSNGNGVYDSGEPRSSNTANKWWVKNFVTGGGNFKGDKMTFAGTVGVDPSGGAIGSFQITDHVSKETYNLDQFVVLIFSSESVGGTTSPPASNNTARFRGRGTRGSDGAAVELVIMIQDNAEPGAGFDKIAVELIRVSGFLDVSGLIGSVAVPEDAASVLYWVTISGGNFQVHDLP